MKGYTQLGEFLRILRIQNKEVMGDMAKVLDVSVPFLSAVETGKKNVPTDWFEALVQNYNLNEEQKEKLKEAIEESKCQIKLKLAGKEDIKRQVALKFARSFDDMDSNTAEQIIKILEENKNGL